MEFVFLLTVFVTLEPLGFSSSAGSGEVTLKYFNGKFEQKYITTGKRNTGLRYGLNLLLTQTRYLYLLLFSAVLIILGKPLNHFPKFNPVIQPAKMQEKTQLWDYKNNCHL